MTAADLAAMSAAELGRAMEAGHPIDPADLDDTEYRGVSLGLPGIVERLTWKTFVKAFHRDPATGALRGWNVRIDQRHPLDYRAMTSRGRPRTFGHFRVVPAADRPMPRPYGAGLLLDYGGRMQATRALRDPIVAVEAGSTDLLLGWSYLEVGGRQLPTPSFFTLERDRPLAYIPG